VAVYSININIDGTMVVQIKLLLQCVDNSLFQGAPMPYHVRVHAERRKTHMGSDGLFGKHCDKDDWGNWIADRIAAQDHDILTRHGIQIVNNNNNKSDYMLREI
jgi:hypothetical protein